MIVMSTHNSDDFCSLIAFASQLIFVLHDNLIPSIDCLNPTGINRRYAKKSKAGNCLHPSVHMLKVNDALWVNNGFISCVTFDHKAHHHGDHHGNEQLNEPHHKQEFQEVDVAPALGKIT